MKKILLLLLTTSLFIGCGNKQSEETPLAGTVQEDGSILEVKSDSVVETTVPEKK